MIEQESEDFVRYDTPAAIYRQMGLTIRGFGSTARKTALCGPRALDCFAAVYVQEGSGWVETAATTGRLCVRSDTLIWLFPSVIHSYAPDEFGWSERWVMFDGSTTRSFERLGFLSPTRPVLHTDDTGEIASIFAQMRNDFAVNRPLCGLLSAALVQRLVVLSHLAMTATREDDSGVPFDVRRTMTQLEERALEPLDLAGFARECGMGYSTFRRRFKQATGYSPKEFVVRSRLRRAKELLALTSWSVTDVATAVGVDDPYYFSRLFTAKEGLTPSAFRAQQRF